MAYQINNVHERVGYNKLLRYFKATRNLYGQSTEQLDNVRRDYDNCIMLQPPYTNSVGKTQHNDLSVLDKKNGVDYRIEIKSLIPNNSSLRNAAYEHIMESKNYPEKMLILVLLNNGYNNQIIKGLKHIIELDHFPVHIVRTIDELHDYIRCRMKRK